MNLDNCPRCGKLYTKNIRDVCMVCMREIDKEYEKCVEYLREFKGATMVELSDQTGVSIKQITKFIREGRISIVNTPNLFYPCESCGTLIRDSQLCDNCRQRFLKAGRQSSQQGLQTNENAKQSEGTFTSYKGLSKYKDR